MSTVPAFSCFVSTVGLVLPFILTDPPFVEGTTGLAIPNAESATVTWWTHAGVHRLLTLSNAESAVFTYTVSIQDTRSPKLEEGYLAVSIGTAVFYTSSFLFRVNPHF